MTDNNINYLAKLLELKDNMPFCTYKEEARWLLENGVIVPPCKVGDVVYGYCDVFGAILPYIVQNFGVGFMGKDRPNCWFWEATSHATETDELLDEIDFDLDDIGKWVFLTKEEAERELEKRCNNAR